MSSPIRPCHFIGCLMNDTRNDDEAIKEFLSGVGQAIRWLFNCVLDFPLVFIELGIVIVAWSNFASEQYLSAFIVLLAGTGVVLLIKPKLTNEYLRRKARRKTLAVMRKSLYKEQDGLDASRFVKVKRTRMKGVFHLKLKTPIGRSDKDVMSLMPDIAAALRLQTILELDDDPRAGVVVVVLGLISPLDTDLDGSQAQVLNLTPYERTDPYLWLEVGVDAGGHPFSVPLFLEEGGSVRSLHAGTSGAGKSSIVRQQLLQATLNPFIDVVVVDGKGSEFGDFEPHISMYATNKVQFFDVLRFLEDEVKRRGQVLNENKRQAWERFSNSWNNHDDGNFLLFVWDEIGVILAGLPMKETIEVQSRLYGVFSVARSLGISVILSSQTFRSDILDTKTRDNCFDLAIGFKTNSPQESNYLGFSLEDDIRPDKIAGKLLKTGRTSSVGQFASRGVRNAYGKSFFITDNQIREALF